MLTVFYILPGPPIRSQVAVDERPLALFSFTEEMSHLPFLDFPLTIRQQIYAELLISPFHQDAKGNYSHAPFATNILHVNRKIYSESSELFYGKNLFVVIRSNSEENLVEITAKKTPIFLDAPSRVAQCTRFAASIEILGIKQLRPAQSAPLYIITAAALPLFASAMVGDVQYSNGGGVVQIQTHEKFRYTDARFSELLFGQLLSANRLPRFDALRIEGTIQPDHHRSLMERCISNQYHACGFFSLGMRCFRDRVWFRMYMENKPNSAGIKNEIPEHQIHELPRLILRMTDIFWSSHEYQMRELDHPCSKQQVHLFDSAVDSYDALILSYLLAAQRHPDRASEAYMEARKAAESGISYLNRDDRIIYDSNIGATDMGNDTKRVQLLQRAKARLSLKAAKVCRKMGDRKAAASYIKDAGRQDPMSNAREKLLTLGWGDWPQMTPQSRHPPVLWKTEDAAV